MSLSASTIQLNYEPIDKYFYYSFIMSCVYNQIKLPQVFQQKYMNMNIKEIVFLRLEIKKENGTNID